MSDDEVRQAIREHVARAFAGQTIEDVPATAHAREAIPSLGLLRVKADPAVYVTVGAWEATRDDPESMEFFVAGPIHDAAHQETLSTAAYYHSFYGLDVGRTLKVARGWIPG